MAVRFGLNLIYPCLAKLEIVRFLLYCSGKDTLMKRRLFLSKSTIVALGVCAAAPMVAASPTQSVSFTSAQAPLYAEFRKQIQATSAPAEVKLKLTTVTSVKSDQKDGCYIETLAGQAFHLRYFKGDARIVVI